MRKILLAAAGIILSALSTAYANDYYTHGSFPAPGSPATSAGMRAELDLISAGFDKLPALQGNEGKFVIVGPGGSLLTTTDGTITLSNGLTITGAYDATLALTGTTSVTLPTSGTLATVAGTETLSSKTINFASNTLTGTLAQFNTALSDGDFATLAGTETLTNKTLTAPALNAAVIGSGSAVGTTGSTQAQLRLGGTFAPGASAYGTALDVRTTVTGQANQDIIGVVIFPTLNEAASGTHAWVSSLEIDPPTIGAGGAAITKAATLRITGAPSAGGNNYALHVDEGDVKINGAVQIEAAVSGNPNIHFDDGPSDHYFEVNTGSLHFFSPGHVRWSPGSGEKARFTDTGKFLLGTTSEGVVGTGGINMTGALGLTEIGTPSTPSANGAVLYARDNGAGKTQLVVMFSDGTPQVVCTQP